MNMLVSIVVPVYNVEQYILPCLDSIYMQSDKCFEVIFVDDCGDDYSMNIIQDYITNHAITEWKIVRHKRNRGLSAARNTGLRAAQGDYVLFLDSDDCLGENAVNNLTSPLQKKKYDFVVGNFSDSISSVSYLKESRSIEGNNEILQSYANGEWYVMAWNKLCNREFLVENNLFFEEGLLHEDVIWSFKLACTASNMYVVSKNTYVYTIRQNSIMTSLNIEKDLSIYMEVFDLIAQYIQEKKLEWNQSVYILFYGKRAGILYSLLERNEINLFKKYYLQLKQQCYLSPLKAFAKGIVSWQYLLRDFHYVLPVSCGRLYFVLFYNVCYGLRRKKIEGAIWK